jgi:hypothetical protein
MKWRFPKGMLWSSMNTPISSGIRRKSPFEAVSSAMA